METPNFSLIFLQLNLLNLGLSANKLNSSLLALIKSPFQEIFSKIYLA